MPNSATALYGSESSHFCICALTSGCEMSQLSRCAMFPGTTCNEWSGVRAGTTLSPAISTITAEASMTKTRVRNPIGLLPPSEPNDTAPWSHACGKGVCRGKEYRQGRRKSLASHGIWCPPAAEMPYVPLSARGHVCGEFVFDGRVVGASGEVRVLAGIGAVVVELGLT